MLFQKNDSTTTVCQKCDSERFSESGSKALKQMKMVSVGDHVARLLMNDDMRNLMRYRHNYQHESGVYKDYFDGRQYQKFKQTTNLFSSEDDVALALFVDGFRPSKSNTGDKLAIIHLLNMNIPPEYR
jgi:hypothetical protein